MVFSNPHLKTFGTYRRNAPFFNRIYPALVTRTGVPPLNDLIVANDGVHRINSLTCLHLAVDYGPLRSKFKMCMALSEFASHNPTRRTCALVQFFWIFLFA